MDNSYGTVLTGFSFHILFSSYFGSVYLWESQCCCFVNSDIWIFLYLQIRFFNDFVKHIYIRSVVMERLIGYLLLSSSSSSSPLCRVFIFIFLRETMSLGNTVLQLFFCYYSWCLVSVLNLLYFYIITSRSMCAVPNMAVFWSSLTSCFIIIIIIIIIIITMTRICQYVLYNSFRIPYTNT